jgi:glycosyltransferase involved in cell wall biosynthesis
VFIWFADKHAYVSILLAKLLGRRSILVVGGYDVAKIPEKEYGLLSPHTSMFNRFRVRWTLSNADLVLAVDESLKKEAIKNAGINADNFQTLPTGYDPRKWFPSDDIRKTFVLTVGYLNRTNLWRKGFLTFIKVAKELPEITFILSGPDMDGSLELLRDRAPSNVIFPGYVTDQELLTLYQGAKVYCQLSRYEGFPNVLCEAMLCECVPVGTPVNGIPTIIGKTGYYVPYNDVDATAKAVNRAFNSNNGPKARERIMENFSSQKREEELKKIIQGLMKS